MNTNEELKIEIITEFYNTGRIQGLYFGRTSKSKQNPLRVYIQKYLYKNFLLQENDLEDDIYQETFYHLQNMPADKFMAVYRESPNKLIATALRIVVLKCFANDNRTGNPKHSLTKLLSFTSSFNAHNYQINPIEKKDEDDSENYNNELIIYDECVDEFESQYGVTVEELLDNIHADDKEFFYFLLGNKKRGKPSKEFVEKRESLFERIREIKNDIIRRNNGDR